MRKRVTVQAPTFVGQTPAQLSLAAGQAATFGVCHCGGCDVDLPIRAGELPALTGRIVVGADLWLLSNLSDGAPMVVVNMDDWYQYIVVDPGRRGVPVPFELAQIELTASRGGPKVVVFGFEPHYTGCGPVVCYAAASQRRLLDYGSIYFSVLKELCRSRLGGAIDARLPTSVEIAERLRPYHRTISARAVDAHIRYVSEKLRLPKGAGRDALVAVVIRSNLLRQPT